MQNPTRRTVLRTAAWTAPTVALVAAAPAQAASGCPTLTASSCTRHGHTVTVTLTFSSATPVVVTAITDSSGRVVWDDGQQVTGTGVITFDHHGPFRAGTVTFTYLSDPHTVPLSCGC